MFKITREVIAPQSVISVLSKPIMRGQLSISWAPCGTIQADAERCILNMKPTRPMAEKKMAEIGQEIQEKWGLNRVAMIHRVGRLEIGEVSVAVAVASPHRSDGFEACKYAMDRLKQVVPIWKREIWEDGAEEWVKPDPVYFDADRGVRTSDG